MAKGGKRPGAGRKKGSKDKATLEKEKVSEALRQRVMEHADILFNAQMTLARGQTYLFKIEKKLVLGPKGGKRYLADRPKLVTEPSEIENYLAGKYEEGDPEDENSPDATYYYITSKDPDNRAIDSMFDRTFGKPKESLDVTTGGDKLNPFTPDQLKRIAEGVINKK